MEDASADPQARLAAFGGLLFAIAVVVFLTGLALNSPSTVRGAVGLALVAVAVLAAALGWSAWQTFSWWSVLLIACPVVAFTLSLRLNENGSGLSWTTTQVGATATLAACVGLAARPARPRIGRAVALGIAWAVLLGLALVLLLALLWEGDLN